MVANPPSWCMDQERGERTKLGSPRNARLPLTTACWCRIGLGYGRSPDVQRSDYAEDAREVAELLGDGAHLVGHSSGGVVALLAAAASRTQYGR